MEAENRSFRIRQAPGRDETRAAIQNGSSLGFIVTDESGKERTLWCMPRSLYEHEYSRQCTLRGGFGHYGTGVVSFWPEKSEGTIETIPYS